MEVLAMKKRRLLRPAIQKTLQAVALYRLSFVRDGAGAGRTTVAKTTGGGLCGSLAEAFRGRRRRVTCAAAEHFAGGAGTGATWFI
jgi:hypothetical protein